MAEIFLVTIIMICFAVAPQETNQQGILSLNNANSLKGISALLILFGHCTAIDRSSFLCKLNVGWYCVAVFMFISGWGITYSYRNKPKYLQNFWKSRFWKIVIPFISAHIIYSAVKMAYGKNFTFNDVISGLLGQCTIVDNSWYPVAAIIFYFLFWIVFQLHITEKFKPVLLSVFVLMITLLEFKFFGLSSDWWFISNFSFVFGIALCFYSPEVSNRKRNLGFAAVGYFLAYCMIPGFRIIFGRYSDVIYVLASNFRSAFLALVIVLCASYYSPRSKILAVIGRISYEIYLIHGLFIFVFSRYIKDVISLFLLTLICSLISSYFLNKIHNLVYDKLHQCSLY